MAYKTSSLHNAAMYEVIKSIPANGSITIPFSRLGITIRESYIISAFAVDNAAWHWYGTFFYSVNGMELEKITKGFVSMSVSGTNLVVTNTHPDYGMPIKVKVIG